MNKTFGTLIAELRKEKGLTQAQLAEQMGVTDKAVSKWERDMSYPDTALFPKLSEIFGVSIDQLMKGENITLDGKANKNQSILKLVFKAVGLAMGIAVVVLSILNQLDTKSALIMLGVGLFSIGLYLMDE